MPDPEITTFVAGFTQYPPIVPALCQHKCQVAIRKKLGFVDRPPRRNVIGLSCNHEHRDRDIFQCNDPTFDRETPRCQTVLQKKTAQILRVHPCRHAGRVAVPNADIRGQIVFAKEVPVDSAGIDQVFRTNGRKRAGHLGTIKKPLIPHHIFNESDLTFINKQK